jgi:hypothetical protein
MTESMLLFCRVRLDDLVYGEMTVTGVVKTGAE